MAFRRVTIADIWGQAMEVPEENLNLNGESCFSMAPDGWAAGAADHEARMLIPGAAISGCNGLRFVAWKKIEVSRKYSLTFQ